MNKPATNMIAFDEVKPGMRVLMGYTFCRVTEVKVESGKQLINYMRSGKSGNFLMVNPGELVEVKA